MSSSLSPYLRALTDNPAGLTQNDMRTCLHLIFTGDVPPVQTASFLAALRTAKLDRNPAIIAAAVSAMKEFSLTVELTENAYVDIVGTGGDGKDTFNVSTTSALVAAGMGINVCKHGNRASTSTSGAADVLMSLGASPQCVTPTTINSVLQKSKFCFLFAPVYHPIMGVIAPIRKQLGFPTIFNILGPLLNPAPISARIIGVNVPELGQVFAETLQLLDKANAIKSSSMIVWGEEGLDEISPAGKTRIWRVSTDSDEIVESTIEPSDFGLERHELDTVASGTPDENSDMVNKLLNNELPIGHPVLDYVLMNSAALAVVNGRAKNWKAGVEAARESIASGSAKKALEAYVKATSEIKNSASSDFS
ncbi:glycosyl transferase family, a/b domain-containing protein [Dipodascopsis uninucleata]